MTPEQSKYIIPRLKGAMVDDIGCGYSPLLPFIATFDYLGIDKEYINQQNTIQFNLEKLCPHLRFDIAFVSWPINRVYIAWHLFLDKYKEIIYIGCNTGGIVCGDPNFWKIVEKREVLHIIPSPRETLIHYGPKSRVGTKMPAEEYHGKNSWNGDIGSYSSQPWKTKNHALTTRGNKNI